MARKHTTPPHANLVSHENGTVAGSLAVLRSLQSDDHVTVLPDMDAVFRDYDAVVKRLDDNEGVCGEPEED